MPAPHRSAYHGVRPTTRCPRIAAHPHVPVVWPARSTPYPLHCPASDGTHHGPHRCDDGERVPAALGSWCLRRGRRRQRPASSWPCHTRERPAHRSGAYDGISVREDPASRRTRKVPHARVRLACVSLRDPLHHRRRAVSLHGGRYGPRRVPLSDYDGTRECGAAWLELYRFVRQRQNVSAALPTRCPEGGGVVCCSTVCARPCGGVRSVWRETAGCPARSTPVVLVL